MSDVTPNSAPMGGTELILGHLKTALPELTDQVQIMCSRPEQYEFDPLKPKILWLQDLPQDPASACLKDATYRSQFNKIVFVSHWQQQMYNAYLGIPYHEGVVIKNAVPFIPTTPKKLYVPCGNDEQQCDAACKATHQKEKLRFVYTSTPHRGLVILAAAAEALAAQRQDWQLDVYSSLNIYGLHEADKQFTELYEHLKTNPCINYHGSQPNAIVRQALQDAHVFVYPSIYMETSCMAVQEAMMSGCLAITTNFGALPETVGEWGWMFQFTENGEDLCQRTYATMNQAIERYHSPEVQDVLKLQRWYYQTFYAFESRVETWKHLLQNAIAEGPKRQMLIIE
jgi:UDP-glucose:(glucosyl)LPS alpha-1,2-glucosyltransferase